MDQVEFGDSIAIGTSTASFDTYVLTPGACDRLQDTRKHRFDISSFLEKGVIAVHSPLCTPSTKNEHQILSTNKEKGLIYSIVLDDKVQLLAQAKHLLWSSSDKENNDEKPDRGRISNLLHLCCVFDAVECATALIDGDAGAVPILNEIDASGWSALHSAASAHARKCIELLLRRRACTDLKSKDGRSQRALELALSSRRMEVIWTVDDPIEDLLVCLNQKDLSVVRLLSEKTKEIAEVAYSLAIEGQVVSLAALLIVAAEKVLSSTVVVRIGGDSGSKEKISVYDCLIREALSAAGKGSGASHNGSDIETAEKRQLLLCEIELCQLFGAVAQRCCTDKKVVSPLIRATQAADEAVVTLLLKENKDINEVDPEGNSALHWSVKISGSSTQLRIICHLLKHGAQVSQRNKLGLNALHIAASNGNLHALQILLLEDPDCVNATTEMKETPLFFAVRNSHVDCVELLLRWGANSKILNLRLLNFNVLNLALIDKFSLPTSTACLRMVVFSSKQRPIDFAKSQDMRFTLSPTNIGFMTRASSSLNKHITTIVNDEANEQACESLPTAKDGDSRAQRCSNTKAKTCKYFDSPGGCARGAKCYYAHGDEDLCRLRRGLRLLHCRDAELKRKIFVGGLPHSLDSDSLGKFFEHFGALEEANVIGAEAGNQSQSRGFGFITFKHEKSVSAAVQTRFVTIMGKQVEIKRVVTKNLAFPELQQSPRKQDEHYEQDCQPTVVNEKNKEGLKNEQISWADKLFRDQKNAYSNQPPEAQCSPISVHRTEPVWFITFKKWLPKFLKEANSRLGQEEYYPLSSLKGDFRATCNLELDHESVGYSKLSDFMRSLPDICRMMVVPVGLGPATHMILLPLPENQLPPYSRFSVRSLDFSEEPNSDDSVSIQDAFSTSSDDLGFLSSNSKERRLLRDVSNDKVNVTPKDTSPGVHPRFLQFLKPDLLFHARPWLTNNDKENALESGSENFKRGVWS